MPKLPRILLAVAPTTPLPQLAVPTEFAYMAYRIGSDGQLFRTHPEIPLDGGFLMISGAVSHCRGYPKQFFRQVLTECHTRHALGVIANWESAPEYASFTTQLDHTLAGANLEFWVPEYYANAAPSAQIMISSQLSGGMLSERIKEAVRQWGSRIVLAVECTPWDFQLPCASGQGTLLAEGQVSRLMKEHNARFWFSEALCSQYFTYQSNNELHLVLFENTDSVRAKLNRATQRNLPGVLFSWDEISHIAHDLFAHKTGQRMPNHPP